MLSSGRAARLLKLLCALGVVHALVAPTPAQAQGGPPQCNLLIELRQVRAVDVDEAAPGLPPAPRSTTLSTRSLADDPPEHVTLQFRTAVAPVIYGAGWDVLAAIGLAILVVFFRNRGTIDVEDVNVMKG